MLPLGLKERVRTCSGLGRRHRRERDGRRVFPGQGTERAKGKGRKWTGMFGEHTIQRWLILLQTDPFLLTCLTFSEGNASQKCHLGTSGTWRQNLQCESGCSGHTPSVWGA